MPKTLPSIYEVRQLGREFCNDTEGSEHYKGDDKNIEPAEYAIQNDFAEDWIITNIVKYITRFKKTRDINDLKKISDYTHILCGIEIINKKPLKPTSELTTSASELATLISNKDIW